MDKIYDVIIIGSGSAGLAAGLYAGRAQMSTLIIEKDMPGGQIKITSEVVNYPGVATVSGEELSRTMKAQAEGFGARFMSATVQSLQLADDIKEVTTDKGVVRGLSVIAATGAQPRELNFKGESKFKGKGIGFCATCDGEFFNGLQVFIIGAGFAAAEEALYLTRFAKNVTIIAREPQFTCSKTIADKVLAHPKITTRFNSEIVEAGGESVLKYAKFKDNKTGEQWEYRVQEGESTFGIFIFAGYVPQSKLFEPYVKTDREGYILTDEDMHTTTPGVFAAGDIRVKSLRQLITAAADGAIAAQSAERYVTAKRQLLGLPASEKSEDEQTCGIGDGDICGIEGMAELRKAEDNHKDVEVQADCNAAEGCKIPQKHHDSSEYLDDNLRQQISEVLAKLTNDVTIAMFDDGSDIAQKMIVFVKEFEKFSGNIKINIYSKSEESEAGIKAEIMPSIALIRGDGTYSGIQFHGVPGGHEIESFVLALYNVGGPGQSIEASAQSIISSIDRPVNVKIGVSLSCSLCPDVVAYTQLIAANNKNVEAEMVDVAHFADFRTKHAIMSVPAIVIDDTEVYFGKRSLEEVAKLIKGSIN